MHIGSSRNTLLKMAAEIIGRGADGARVPFRELEREVLRYQAAGVVIYGARSNEEIRRRMREDVRRLESLHLLRTADENTAMLTGAGEVLALNLEFPSWVNDRLGQRAPAESR